MERELRPAPSNVPVGEEIRGVSYDDINLSDGAHATEGSWASGPTPDGHGESRYVDSLVEVGGVGLPGSS